MIPENERVWWRASCPVSKMLFLTQRLLPSDDLIVFVRRQKAIEIDNALSGGDAYPDRSCFAGAF